MGRGNIGVHSRKERRYICHPCHKTFSATTGTLFYRLRTDWNVITRVVTRLAHDCPLQAMVVAFAWDERTVHAWQPRAGPHCERMHAHLGQRLREWGHVQADEIRVKQQGQIVWLAMALQVATRLWLGATVGPHRDAALLTRLGHKIRAGALGRPMRVCVDGGRAYPGILRNVFREALPSRGGRPQLQQWDGLVIAQGIKQYEHGRGIGVLHRVIEGTAAQGVNLLPQTRGGQVIHTASIERLNATFRLRLASLIRRGRCLGKQLGTLHDGVYVVGTVYNFCTFHTSLRVGLVVGSRRRRHWAPRTPAMATGITDHRWTVQEVLTFRVPPSRGTPPTQRGRPSKALKALIKRWC